MDNVLRRDKNMNNAPENIKIWQTKNTVKLL